jgi:hypothetical protein
MTSRPRHAASWIVLSSWDVKLGALPEQAEKKTCSLRSMLWYYVRRQTSNHGRQLPARAHATPVICSHGFLRGCQVASGGSGYTLVGSRDPLEIYTPYGSDLIWPSPFLKT